MKINSLLDKLKKEQNASTLKRYEKIEEVKPYYGVPMGAITSIAKDYKNQFELVLPLWQTMILEAQYLAIQIARQKPNHLSADELKECLMPTISVHVLDKLTSTILAKRTDYIMWKEYLLHHEEPIFQRLGWSLQSYYLANEKSNSHAIEETLKWIKKDLLSSHPLIQWTMNECLVTIAVHHPQYREQGMIIGKELGLYADSKVAKGCTSAYAPDWIEALVRKQSDS